MNDRKLLFSTFTRVTHSNDWSYKRGTCVCVCVSIYSAVCVAFVLLSFAGISIFSLEKINDVCVFSSFFK